MRIHVIDSDKHDAKILKSQLSEGMGDCLDSLSVYATWQAFIENEIVKDQFTVVFFSASEMVNPSNASFIADLVFRKCSLIVYHSTYEHTIKAIKMGIFDYIVTPFRLVELNECFYRLVQKFQCDKSTYNIVLRDAKGSQVIPLKNISHIQAFGAYSRIYSIDKEYFICRTLKSLEEEIGEPFIRIHRSFMVHAGQIKCYNINTVTLNNKQKLPVSRTGRVKLIAEIPQTIMQGIG